GLASLPKWCLMRARTIVFRQQQLLRIRSRSTLSIGRFSAISGEPADALPVILVAPPHYDFPDFSSAKLCHLQILECAFPFENVSCSIAKGCGDSKNGT